MPALQTKSNSSPQPVIYDDVFNQPQLKPLVYKPVQLTVERKTAERKLSGTRNRLLYMGLVIPFQPCMWDDKKRETAWNEAMEMVQRVMKGKYTAECTNKLMTRLSNMFGRLNFNTHRKSLALILTPLEEKMFYLNFHVKPVAFFSKKISVLELAANYVQETGFYYLVLCKNSAKLFDYSQGELRKINEQKQEPDTSSLFQKAFSTIELLNGKNEKPVFVTGSPNLAELFCSSHEGAERYFPLLNHKEPYNDAIIMQTVEEIINHWNCWWLKFMGRKMVMAQLAGRLYTHIEAVLQQLRKNADGLLLIDKKLNQQLQKPATKDEVSQTTPELMVQLEHFITRGNRIEITANGVLKNMGGIVLLANFLQHSSLMIENNLRVESPAGEMF